MFGFQKCIALQICYFFHPYEKNNDAFLSVDGIDFAIYLPKNYK